MTIVERLNQAISQAMQSGQVISQFDLTASDYNELRQLLVSGDARSAGFNPDQDAFRGYPLHHNDVIGTSMAIASRGAIFLWNTITESAIPTDGGLRNLRG
ncbi:hypothetical protein ABI_39230 [Asticcacaulis biprosthecium C19]|uniref:Uncharacterized protein n=1 Tax=Asticcacaulis biprosthecium C19 TaxID=715226 RepID=F4QRY9_9CAUL|nr:hypothetical protein [Asticcacaulis biprosthecium]EGF89509.1 hypothetical protein ABI_39230 [Asticcacaulis biprosthecium C19]